MQKPTHLRRYKKPCGFLTVSSMSEVILPPIEAKEVRELYAAAREDYDLRRAVMYLKLIRTSYSSGDKSLRCENVVIENQDFETLIRHYDRPDSFFYCDPPYFTSEYVYDCFDDNKAYLRRRLLEEQNPAVRKILQKDVEFLDRIQVEMATARQFLFLARVKNQKEKQVFDTANRVEKLLSEQGFEVHRLKKPEIKRFLALFFDASLNGEAMPDLDGAQFFGEDIRE